METSSVTSSVTGSSYGIGTGNVGDAATIEALPGQQETDAAMLQLFLLLSKIGSMLMLGLGSLLLGMMPLLIGRCRTATVADGSEKQRRPITSVSNASTTTPSLTSGHQHHHQNAAHDSQGLLTSLLLCFGGGVLLFTTFLHLAPEVRESVEKHQTHGRLPVLGSLSLAELLFCAGFFFVYLVEETVHAALSSKPEILLYRTVSVRRCNNNNNNSNHKNGHPNLTSHQQQINRSDSSDDEERGAGTIPGGEHLQRRPVVSKTPMFSTEHHHHHQVPNLKQQSHTSDNSMRSLLTVLALSFHAIFEGLTVGLETTLGSVLYLAGAIATHKLVISFCVGMELYCAGASQRAILGYLSVFSLVTPLGIGIGLALGDSGQHEGELGPVPAILQAMAAGTLLYVVFFEVLARERANDKSGLLQLTAILVGFLLMMALQLATAHTHSHDHSDDAGHKEDHDHEHEHAGDSVNYLIGGVIERTTNKVAEVLSTTLT